MSPKKTLHTKDMNSVLQAEVSQKSFLREGAGHSLGRIEVHHLSRKSHLYFYYCILSREIPLVLNSKAVLQELRCAAHWDFNATLFGQAKFQELENQDPRLSLARKEANASIMYKNWLWRICQCPPTGEKFQYLHTAVDVITPFRR